MTRLILAAIATSLSLLVVSPDDATDTAESRATSAMPLQDLRVLVDGDTATVICDLADSPDLRHVKHYQVRLYGDGAVAGAAANESRLNVNSSWIGTLADSDRVAVRVWLYDGEYENPIYTHTTVRVERTDTQH